MHSVVDISVQQFTQSSYNNALVSLHNFYIRKVVEIFL